MTGSPTPERDPARRPTRAATTAASGVSPREGAGARAADGLGMSAGTRGVTTVRPRRVWVGLAVALLGVALAGIGLATSTWPVVGGAVAALVVGGCLSWAGGVMHDASTGLNLREELHAARHDTTHPGVAAGAQTGSIAAHQEAARQGRVTQQVLNQAHQASTDAWMRPAGWTLLLIAAVLLVSQWELVAHTTTGRANSYRDTGVAIVLALTGLRLALTRGRHPVAAAVAGLSGLGLLLNGLLAGHDHLSLAVVETAAGAIALACAAGAALSAGTWPDPSAPSRTP